LIGHGLKKKIDPKEKYGPQKSCFIKKVKSLNSRNEFTEFTCVNSLQNSILATKKKKLFYLRVISNLEALVLWNER